MTSINPLDISYRYQGVSFWPFWKACAREAADPSIINYRGRYYLFPSMSGGFWHSDDLISWRFVGTETLPSYDYAPDVREIDNKLVVCASQATGTASFYRTSDPLKGNWEVIPVDYKFFDPNLFQDDDGRVYLYNGCINNGPITGQELDRTTFAKIGDEVKLIHANVPAHGFERIGEKQDDDYSNNNSHPLMQRLAGKGPYIEGAWMTKHRGTYYLQYAAPGTQLVTYSDGYYTASSPLGPFIFAPNSPFSSKQGGFMGGAGHGSTMQDKHGNWWHVATMTIAVNFMFERRLGLWPAGFDQDGALFCNQEFGDWPMRVPDGPADPWSLSARSILLSYKRPVQVSSSLARHGASYVTDENTKTWWVSKTASPGQWAMVDLEQRFMVDYIQVNLADHNVSLPGGRPTTRTLLWKRHIDMTEPAAEILVEGSTDGSSWSVLHDSRGSRESRSHFLISVNPPTELRYIRTTGFGQPYGAMFAISGLRVFGKGYGVQPQRVKHSCIRSGPRNILVEWEEVEGAIGYNIRYGLEPNKLYISWQIFDQTSQLLGSINAGHVYWVAVDVFNCNGITRGEPQRVPA